MHSPDVPTLTAAAPDRAESAAKLPAALPPECDESSVAQRSPAPDANCGFWTRHRTLVNFWLDALLLVLFLVTAWEVAVISLVFPRGAGADWTLWGLTVDDWQETLAATFAGFACAVVLHVMLHWTWICGTITSRILKRPPLRDDGVRTLLGVGLLFVTVNLVAAGLLIAKVCLKGN